jgi:hypothetical protein
MESPKVMMARASAGASTKTPVKKGFAVIVLVGLIEASATVLPSLM